MASDLGVSPLSVGDELPVAEARARLLAAVRAVPDTVCLPLSDALGRVLAADVVSPMDVPAHDNSAMDGYALHGADLLPDSPTVLSVLPATVLAGAPLPGPVARGHCVRIMTGAVMPTDLDTVVPQELCQREGDRLVLAAGLLRPGEHRRLRGEDLALGQLALPAGRVLRPADLGLLASLGLAEVRVRRRLKVALFSTGNELRSPGEPLPPGCIYDSNRHSLHGALSRLGLEVLDLGCVPDEPAALRATLDRAVAEADVVLTSGGVSVGDADFTKALLAERGEVSFWKVAMRPGRPFAFGPLNGPAGRRAWLLALPGNPVAALVAFHVLARDALCAMAGALVPALPALRVRSAGPIRKRPGRSEYQRGIVSRAADGEWEVRLTGAQGAGMLRSMTEANALVVLAPEQGSVAAGEPVDVWLFDGLL